MRPSPGPSLFDQSALSNLAERLVASAKRAGADAADAVAVRSISLSIEPEASAPGRETLPPVQLPDYVLPDDGSEEATHAGS